ncbi:MAG: polysaccharide biosynthesis tyrosine autokinase [Candidatus Cloacimonetes bacterium]|nr:polysaccharide biosynthesis tyrosine autokinase [Candidatus Cloacimonadota bacterium]
MERTNVYYDQESEIKLSDYFRIMFHFKWLIISIFILFVAGTIVYTARSPRIYKASTKVILEDKKNDMFYMTPGFGSYSLNNNIEILKSRPVMQIALDLLQQNEKSLEFPIMESGGPLGTLISGIQVETKRETDILTISFESTSPDEAAAVCNATAQALIEQNRSFARMELTRAREFLGEQVESISARLRNAEEDLRLYKLQQGISLLSEETKQLIEKSSDLEAALQVAETDLSIKNEHLFFLQRELGKQDSLLSDINTVLSSPLLDQMRNKIVELESRYTSLLTRREYTEDHPELLNLKKEIEEGKSRLNKTITNMIQVKEGSSDPLAYRGDLIQKIALARIEQNVATSKVEGLKKALIDYNRKITLLPDTELALARLQRNYSINEKLHSLLVEKYEDSKIAEQAKMGNVRLVEEAIVPGKPVKPKKMMNLMVGLVLGLGVGIGTAFLLHSLDTKIRTMDDMENYVKLPVIGTIPRIKSSSQDYEEIDKLIKATEDKKERDLLEQKKSQIAAKLIANYAPKSPVAEAYRILRTNLIAKRKNNSHFSVLVTSSGPKEGKSTTISNLAITLAQMDSKVILVDLDLRRPMAHNIFGLEKENGISDYILNNAKREDIIKSSGIRNLDIITSGFIPPYPSEILASEKMGNFIEELKQTYSYVLIDTPPIIAVTDALILGRLVDQLVLVISIDFTDRDIIKRTKEMLKNIDIEISGVIANGIDVHKYYSGYSYYYYYYYYYSDEKNNGKRKRKNKPLS